MSKRFRRTHTGPAFVPPEQISRGEVVSGALFFEGSLLVLALILGRLLGYPPLAGSDLGWTAIGVATTATVLPLVGLLWSVHSQIGPLVRLRAEIRETILPLFAGCSLGDLAGISVMAGLAEECLFRGVIQKALGDLVHPGFGLVLSSTLFALGHLITPAYAVLAALIGLYLGGLLLITGNLLVPVLVHSLYDFLALVYLTRRYRSLS